MDNGSFDEAGRKNPDVIPLPTHALLVDLDGYEGPLDVLLVLARDQKVDLLKISILQLAEQYLAFIEQARSLRLEVAADYLVMAAWLAYLKSRLLLPAEEDDGPSGEELADRLAFLLKKLEAMREAAEKLMNGSIVGRDRLQRGRPEAIRITRHSKYDCTLRELLQAYAAQEERKGIVNPLRLMRDAVFSVEAALDRLEKMLGSLPDWTDLMSYLPDNLTDPFSRRSAQASTLLASLQMAKEGRLELRQGATFGPIEVKKRKNGE
ncbi:segregation/condensation protein A [Sneathiella chungangensis]|uniref:Segregation and condensation protein A n=1 Tax=Sneathiella chungangensis TaxID=1418234 RepID=A0A845MD99_9PROT|nr:ScpA family protein [Sneathiella chungangensis]MZR21296.1 segregation/condensation protein A [Sneathiella chungangensis]